MTIGERAKQRRLELQLTQSEVAKRMGYDTKASISKLESSGDKISLKTISKLALALSCTETYLLGFEVDGELIETQNKYERLADEERMLSMYRRLSVYEKELVGKFMESISNK